MRNNSVRSLFDAVDDEPYNDKLRDEIRAEADALDARLYTAENNEASLMQVISDAAGRWPKGAEAEEQLGDAWFEERKRRWTNLYGPDVLNDLLLNMDEERNDMRNTAAAVLKRLNEKMFDLDQPNQEV